MRYIGKILDFVGSCSGSMFVFLTVFLVILLLVLSFLVFALRLIIMSGDISSAFTANGADVVTKVRVDYYTSVAETDRESINGGINLPLNSAYRQELFDSFIASLADSLECTEEDAPSLLLTKLSADGSCQYEISGFRITYGENTGAINAKLRIPINFSSRHLADYSKDLEYRFSFSYKNE